MDLDMYAHAATQANLDELRRTGVQVVEPGDGELASGLSGKGRMAEPAEIVAFAERLLAEKKTLCGKRFVVTAGATIEAIDPVRYISNHSSGKMGYAIAGELAARGAEVTLVTGRTALPTPAGVTRCDVLYGRGDVPCRDCGLQPCRRRGDVRRRGGLHSRDLCGPQVEERRRRADDPPAPHEGHRRRTGQPQGRPRVGGIRARNRRRGGARPREAPPEALRLRSAQSLRDAGAGFRGDTNKVTFVSESGNEPLPLLAKREVAARIADKIETLINE